MSEGTSIDVIYIVAIYRAVERAYFQDRMEEGGGNNFHAAPTSHFFMT